MSARFEPGELVNIHITGARVSDRHAQDKHLWLFADDDAFYLPIRMLANPAVNVSPAAPKKWPPIPGDIWETGGIEEWACRHLDNGTIQMASLSSSLTCWPEKLHDFAPVKLVHRRGWTPETSPAGRDTEPAPEGPAVATTGQPGDRRAATIAGLRELADLLETRPEMPLPQYGLSVSGSLAHGGADDDAASIERVRQAAAVLGAEVDDRIVHQGKRHHAIEAEFGGVRLRLSYIETGAAAAPTDIAQAEGMVAGPEGASGPATAPDDEGDCDDLRTEPEPGQVAPVQDWWFTFGSGQDYDGKYVVIHGTYDSARDVMLAHFDRAWSMQYSSAERAGVEQFGLVELPADLWPTRTDVLEAEPATTGAHTQVAAWGGVPGSSGVECSCGVTYDGFDTIAEAEALRAGHADRDDDEGPATAPEWTPGAGLERLKREMPHIVADLTDDDMRKADEIIAAARPIVESEG